MRNQLILGLVMAGVGAAEAQSQWTATPTPASGTLVGISAPSAEFAIAVGDGGEIVHFVGNDAGALVDSGTTEDLFDVLALGPDFAVASGTNVVLLWDGQSWSPIVENMDTMNPAFYTPVWAPPERDRVLYQQLGGFNSVCPYLVDDPDANLFCRLSSRAVVTLCGTTADTKAVQTDGTIVRYSGGTLSNLDDPLDAPVFEQPLAEALNLIGAHVPDHACIPGNFPPTEAFGLNQVVGTTEFWHFDGSGWSKVDEAGPDETLTGIAGVGSARVFAVGRRPAATKGPVANEGVAWAWDGATWMEEPLPAGAPGLADVAVRSSFRSQVFADGFEAAIAKGGLPPFLLDIIAAAEGGTRFNRPVIELPAADLQLVKTLAVPIPPLSDGNPVQVGDTITYALAVTNHGPAEVPMAVLNDVFFSDQLDFVDSNCPSSLTDQGTRMTLSTALTNLGAGQTVICRPRFEVLSIPLQESGATGVLNVAEVHGSVFDPNPRNNTDACLIDNNAQGSNGNRVQCEIEEIFILVP